MIIKRNPEGGMSFKETLETFDMLKVSVVLPAIMEELDNKEKLTRGAEDLFMRYGLRSVSMDDIARHLGISKKTIYQHFADKDEVVVTVAKNNMNRHRVQFERISRESKNAVEEMVKISVLLREIMRNTNPSLFFDMQKYHQRAWSEWLTFKNKFVRENIIRSLKQGVEEGYFRDDADLDILTTLRMEQVQMAFDSNVYPREKYNIADVQAQLFDHFIHGLFTEKGKKLYQKYKNKNPQPHTIH
jgi:AcrR family transcriptional regulator